jgi:hypothetical protein
MKKGAEVEIRLGELEVADIAKQEHITKVLQECKATLLTNVRACVTKNPVGRKRPIASQDCGHFYDPCDPIGRFRPTRLFVTRGRMLARFLLPQNSRSGLTSDGILFCAR